MLQYSSILFKQREKKARLPTIIFAVAACGLAFLLLTGCSSAQNAGTEAPMTMKVTSPAFAEGQNIPKKFTCDGDNLSPALTWSGVPDGAQSLVLIADDPDAPAGTWVHWVLYNIPSDQTGLPEGTGNQADSSLGVEGITSYKKSGYGGPCPPKGASHRYYFKVYALDTTLSLKAGSTKSDVEKAMQGHILAQGQLMGKYGR
ncbi:MAG: YbhB/YbcL family Raf kinase inhibitor-like protein [Omnitrophica WOR_2 bacterium]